MEKTELLSRLTALLAKIEEDGLELAALEQAEVDADIRREYGVFARDAADMQATVKAALDFIQSACK